MALKRATVIGKMRKAFREGLSATRFIRQMREAGLAYRDSAMYADWRSINQLETKKELLRYVRKDYYPTAKVIAQVTWKLSKEYMYVIRVQSRLQPDEPVTERKINILSDNPLTPREVEALGWEMIQKQSPKRIGEVEAVTGWSAVQRIAE